MSPRLPRVTAGQILRVLRRIGFEEVRSSGSHRILKNAAGKRATVPYHAGEILCAA
ncbi:MAG: type II toxin-antitoxin system HicA family toxin [candidate division NC10 bacterium]|nr:type II toxin-antitoxin system HicA family toxin [candidate division NC10 bacterium]